MSENEHRVLLSIRNPFVRWDKRYASKPCLVWLTRDEIAGGYGAPSPGTEYLLILYDRKGYVRHRLRWEVLR